ncbi:MAG: diaminopimelate epimerase [Candidatus Aminicenantes bacterium]|nr:diaminopimelate epimerase [Candidatus Aminicenantes bacterium]
MIFFKTVCSGNDFVHIDLNEKSLADNSQKPKFTRQICNRKSGAGADGVVYYREHEKSVDFQIFNRDGNEAELSGNGMAGLASILFYLDPSRGDIILNTRVGKRRVGLIDRSGNRFRLSIEIGKADFQAKDFFPFLKENQIKFNHNDIDFYPVSVGNPHVVVWLEEDLSEDQCQMVGEKLATAPIFPCGTNVEIVKKDHHNHFQVFFYERGVGKTLSSSTGSAAVFAVLRRMNQIRDHLKIETPFRKIKISGTEKIFVENFCEIVYKGIFLI